MPQPDRDNLPSKPPASGLRTGWRGLLLALFGAWLFSLAASDGLALPPLRWLSAHTALALEGYAHWGVFATLGANVVLPPGPESVGVELRALSKVEGAYLTYPSLWTLLLYALWTPFNAWVSVPAFVSEAGLVLVRLLGAIAALWTTWEVARLVAPGRPRSQALAALITALAWLLAGPVLYYSQYEVFADQMVLAPCLFATAIALRAGCRLDGLTPPLRGGLALAGLLAWGTEWFGWVTLAVLGLVFAWRSLPELPGATLEARVSAFLARSAVLWAPALLVVAGYAAQLAYFADGWPQLTETFLRRAFSRQNDEGLALSVGVMVSQIGAAALANLPVQVMAGLRATGEALRTGGGLPFALAWPLSALGAACWGLAAVWRAGRLGGAPGRGEASGTAVPPLESNLKAPDGALRERPIWPWLAVALVLLPPALHTLLLAQHATLHPFSGLKWAYPLALLVFGLPLLALNLERRPPSGQLALRLAIALVAIGLLGSARAGAIAATPPDNPVVRDLAAVVRQNLGANEVPVSDDLAFDTMRAHAAYAVGRVVYSPAGWVAIAPKLAPTTLARVSPVVIAYAGNEEKSTFAALAKGHWQLVPQRVGGQAMAIARLPLSGAELVDWAKRGGTK